MSPLKLTIDINPDILFEVTQTVDGMEAPVYSVGKYYRILYARWVDADTPPEPDDYTPMLNESWSVAQKVGTEWRTATKEPVELSGLGHCFYEIPDYSDLFFTHKDILIKWRTPRKDGEEKKKEDFIHLTLLDVPEET